MGHFDKQISDSRLLGGVEVLGEGPTPACRDAFTRGGGEVLQQIIGFIQLLPAIFVGILALPESFGIQIGQGIFGGDAKPGIMLAVTLAALIEKLFHILLGEV